MLKLKQSKIYHADATTAVSVADATADGYGASSALLINACVVAYTAHLASVCDATTGIGAHISADSTNVISAPVATDVATGQTLANQFKTQYNLHIASAVFHCVADTSNAVTASTVTNEATLVTMVNQIKAKLNAHFAGAFTSQAVLLIAP